MYLSIYSPPPYLSPVPNVWKASYTASASIFVNVPYWPPYNTDKLISCAVPGPSQWVFQFGEEIVITWTHIGWVRWMFQNLILHRRKRSMTTVVWLVAFSWRLMEFCTIKCRRFLLNSWDCDVFSKLKEPLQRIRLNTRDELILGPTIRNINKYGRVDGVWRLPNI